MAWAAIVLIVAFGAAATAVVPQAVPILRDMVARFPESGPNIGWLISMPSGVCALGALIAGLWVDRIGDRRMLLGGCVFVAAGDFGVYFAETFSTVLVWRLVEGIGYLALTVGGATMLMRTTKGGRRRAALALWSAHTPIGFALALALVTPLAGVGSERWRWAFAGHAWIVIGLAIIGWFALGARAASTYLRGAGTGVVLRTLGAYRLGFASLCSSLLQTGFLTALPSGLQKRFSLAPGHSAAIAILDLVLNATAALSIATALRRGLSARVGAIIGVVVVAVSWAAFFKADSLPLALVASAAFCFALGGVNALVWGLLPAVTPIPTAAGATSGLVTQATYVGVLIGPPIVFATLQASPWLLALLVGPGAAALLLVALPTRQGGAPGPA